NASQAPSWANSRKPRPAKSLSSPFPRSDTEISCGLTSKVRIRPHKPSVGRPRAGKAALALSGAVAVYEGVPAQQVAAEPGFLHLGVGLPAIPAIELDSVAESDRARGVAALLAVEVDLVVGCSLHGREEIIDLGHPGRDEAIHWDVLELDPVPRGKG